MNKNRPLIYIIILIYNGKQWIEACLNSVLKTDYLNFKVIVIDNDSSDGGADYIVSRFPEAELIRNKKNYGFAEGNNIGIRIALARGADYIVLLNQDTKVDENWLSNMVDVMRSDDSLGILSPMQYNYNGAEFDINFDNNIIRRYTDYYEDKNENNIKDLYFVNENIGAAILLSANMLKKIGLIDALYFTYGEEYDLCRRAIFFGYKVGFTTKAKIYHWHSLIQENIPKKTRYILFRNQFLLSLKNPYNSFGYNLFKYIVIDVWKISGGLKALKNARHCVHFIRAQLWIILNISLIAYSHYKDRKGSVD